MTRSRFLQLAGANFSVALGYGAILPLLPTMLATFERVGTDAAVAWHTGGLLGTYMLGLFVTAPIWGALSDRVGGRLLLVFGLVVYGGALLAFAASATLAAAYGWRLLAAAAGGAVLPVVNASVGAIANPGLRARLFAGVSIALLLGLLAGPALSGFVYAAMQRMGDVREMTSAVISLPLAAAAAFALSVAMVSARLRSDACPVDTRISAAAPRLFLIVWHRAWPALTASFLLLFGLGAFEAALPIIGQNMLSLDAAAISGLLALCMAVMLTIQSGMFLAPNLHRMAREELIGAGFIVVAGGVLILAQSSSLGGAALAVALIGAGGAFLQPAIAYLATLNDAGASGTLLGALTGAGSLGQALGSIAGGALVAAFDAGGLWLIAAGVAIGAATVKSKALGRAGPAAGGARIPARAADDVRSRVID